MTDAPLPSLRDRCSNCLLPCEHHEMACARCNAPAAATGDEAERLRLGYCAFLEVHDRPTENFDRRACGTISRRATTSVC